jgi:hypothetical protein
MTKQPSSEQIEKFRFEAKRCKGHDKEFMTLVGNALLESIDPTTLFKMRAAIYMGEDITWVIEKLKAAQNTFAIGSEVI